MAGGSAGSKQRDCAYGKRLATGAVALQRIIVKKAYAHAGADVDLAIDGSVGFSKMPARRPNSNRGACCGITAAGLNSNG
jgi:hypothetical protein